MWGAAPGVDAPFVIAKPARCSQQPAVCLPTPALESSIRFVVNLNAVAGVGRTVGHGQKKKLPKTRQPVHCNVATAPKLTIRGFRSCLEVCSIVWHTRLQKPLRQRRKLPKRLLVVVRGSVRQRLRNPERHRLAVRALQAIEAAWIRLFWAGDRLSTTFTC